MNDCYVHPTAVVDAGARLGRGCQIWHFVHVSAGAVIGDGTRLGQNVFVGEGVQVGARVKVQNNVSLYEGVIVEDDAFLGPSCVFTNVRNPRAFVSRREAFETTRVGRGATLGANATVVCGRSIGAYALVGAGAVVTHDVAPHALVLGTPARPAGFVCRCGERLPPDTGVCGRCAARYRLQADRCEPA